MALDLSILNMHQREAVIAPNGTTLIIAGPGTGKTLTLAYRIAYLTVRSDISGILALTFTRKAAGEMAARLAGLCKGPRAGEKSWIGTFHCLGLAILRQEGHRIGIPSDAHLLSEPEQRSLIKSVLADAGPKEALNQVGRWIRLVSDLKQVTLSAAELDEDEVTVLRAYEERLRTLKALDFDDLMVKALDLLHEAPVVLDQMRGRYGVILVDEYQDLNDGQYRLIKKLCGDDPHLWVIGDADQAIYAFRGAQVEHFLRFKDDFPETLTITLEKNYRSTPTIVQGALAVINHNVHRLPCALAPTCREGRKIRILSSADETAEARMVAGEIKRIVGGISMETANEHETAYGFDDIAILYRLHALARPLVKALHRAGIPCQVVGGTDSAENETLATLLPFLKAVGNPHDDSAVKGLLPRIDGRFDFAAIASLSDAAQAQGLSLYSYLSETDNRTVSRKKVDTMLRRIKGYHHKIGTSTLQDLLRQIWDDFFQDEDEAVLLELDVLAEPFAHGRASEHLGSFLESIALWKEGETYNPQVEAVTLMSIHAAKGLEFPIIFVVGLEEGIVPCEVFGDDPVDREEERRLFYVAMTRAKRRLYLSSVQERWLFGEKGKRIPSGFLKEIPAAVVTQVQEKKKAEKKPRFKQKSLF